MAATLLIVSCNKGTDKKLEKVLTSNNVKELGILELMLL